MKILVGLGNPGFRYRRTRHNIGFRVVEEVARRLKAKFHTDRKLQALTAQAAVDGEEVLLVKPQSFMNLSGAVVRDVLRRTRAGIADLIVAVDDVHLETGAVRVRSQGSPGGHNGLKSIEEALGTGEYTRVRLGVGSAAVTAEHLAAYVLGRFTRGEEKAVSDSVARAADAMLQIMRDGLASAMNTYNKKRQNLLEIS